MTVSSASTCFVYRLLCLALFVGSSAFAFRPAHTRSNVQKVVLPLPAHSSIASSFTYVNGWYNYEIKVSGDADVGREENRFPLITTAMICDHVKVFNLLLAHPQIELIPKTFEHDPRRHPLFYALFSSSSNRAFFLRKVITHRSFNVNQPIRLKNGHMAPPLLFVTCTYSNLEPTESPPRWALEILIEAGADVHLEIENMRSPYNAVLYFIENGENDTDETTAHYLEALAVMREWPASMKINGLIRGFLGRRRLAAVSKR